MPTLSMAQRKALAAQHSNPWGDLRLLCDGYRVSLQVQSTSKTALSYSVMTYVNGHFKGIWFSDSEDHPEQKFLRRHEKRLTPEARVAELEKSFGKRRVAKLFPDIRKTLVFYSPEWKTYLAALNHLCRVCESVEVIEEAA